MGQDLILHAIGEEGVSFFFAQIFERKDRDRFCGNGDALRSTRDEIICGPSRKNCEEHESGDPSDIAPRRLFRGGRWLGLLKFLRDRGVAQRLSVEIDQMEPDTVLDL